MKLKQIADNVHGTIIIENKLIQDLINTKEFRRLQGIRQLGLTNMLYPSATHTRYMHSLGVYELARRFTIRLGIKDEKKRTAVMVAALLHDIGHGPLSHLFEDISAIDHENYTVMLIKDENSQINKILRKYPSILKQIVQIIEKKHPIKWMNSILSSQIDIDRLDYLKRDSIGTGLNYALIDEDWLFRTASIVNDELVYHPKVIPTLEQFIVGRYHMYSTIYQNPKNIVWQELHSFFFKRLYILIKNEKCKELVEKYPAFLKLANNEMMNSQEFLSLNDSLFMILIKEGVESKDKILKKVAETFFEAREPTYKIIRNKMDEKEFKKKLNSKEEGLTWIIIKQSTDISRYGSKRNEEAIIFDGKMKKRISSVSKIIKRSLIDTKEVSEIMIGVKL